MRVRRMSNKTGEIDRLEAFVSMSRTVAFEHSSKLLHIVSYIIRGLNPPALLTTALSSPARPSSLPHPP